MPTPRANLALLSEGQAQKTVTINENFALLEALTVGGALSRTLATPPTTPPDGVLYIVPASSTGVWAGQTNKIAHYLNGSWRFYAPQDGWHAFIIDELKFYWYSVSATAWRATVPVSNASQNQPTVISGLSVPSEGSQTVELLTGLPANSLITEISIRVPVQLAASSLTLQIGEPLTPTKYLEPTQVFAHQENSSFVISPYENRNSESIIQAIINNPSGSSVSISTNINIIYSTL